MSESREQFRERVGKILVDTTLASVQAGKGIPDVNGDMVEAIYAEALRDVMNLMQEREIVLGQFAVTLSVVTDDEVMNFAAERGIELEAAP